MSTANERVVPKPHSAEIEQDGSDSLNQRVRSLRLPRRKEETRGGSQWVAWILCALLSVATAVLCYLYFRLPFHAAPEEHAQTAKPAVSPNPTVTVGSEASSGEFALQAKGYIITAHQILVSPKVNGMIV
jgi:hypothetical protein